MDDGGATWITPAWSPDGSGFVHTQDDHIYQYTLSDSQITLLATFYSEFVDNPSVSPDGQYVVFERQTTSVGPILHDLWILNRSDPVDMRPLTDDGQSRNPDWSRRDPRTTQKIYLPAVLRR